LEGENLLYWHGRKEGNNSKLNSICPLKGIILRKLRVKLGSEQQEPDIRPIGGP